MSDDTQQPIVVKKIKKGGAGAHGGAWKIAYADFVTAMMAFFLLMWLLGSTAQGDLQGIAEFFQNPLKVALPGGSGSGDSSSILKGGGQDLTRSAGQVKRGQVAEPRMSVNLGAQRGENSDPTPEAVERQRQERTRLLELKSQIEAAMEANPDLRAFRNQLLLDVTSEGLRIQIIDEQARPMFDSASAELKPYTRAILREIGRALNGVENRISLAGHTDAAPFGGGANGYGNWELSANRANASRRELITGGLDQAKMMRVVGLASTVLFDKNDPFSPTNRRISIVVLNKATEEAILGDGKQLEVGNGDVGQAIAAPGPAGG
jgi:chemotaxis protein MotB